MANELKRTKIVQSGKVPNYGHAPNYREPRPNYYDRDASNMIATAHRYPNEALGYALGTYIGNYIDRGKQKENTNLANSIYGDMTNQNGLLGQYASRPNGTDVNAIYGGVDTNRAAQNYIAEGTPVGATSEQNAGGQQAIQAGMNAQQQAQQAVADGMPVTAAGASAMGLNPNDQAKQYLLNYKMNDFAENGPNPSAARRDEAKVRGAMDLMPRMNLIFGNRQQFMDEAEKRVRGSKLSYNRQNEVLARIAEKYDTERNAQAEQYATQLYGKWLQTSPEDFEKEYMPQLLQFAQAGNVQQASPLIQAMAENKARIQKLKDEREMLDYKYGQDISKIYAQKEAAAMYGTGKGNTKEKSAEAQLLAQYDEEIKHYTSLAQQYAGFAEQDGSEGQRKYKDAMEALENVQQKKSSVFKGRDIMSKSSDDYYNYMNQLQYLKNTYGWTMDDFKNSKFYTDVNDEYRKQGEEIFK